MLDTGCSILDKQIITARFAQVAEAAEVKLFLFSVERTANTVKNPGSPRRRLYPPACKPYGLEAEPEAQRTRL